jgi:hypothetical protein
MRLEDAIHELHEGLRQLPSITSEYRSSNMIRFNVLGALTESGQIDNQLRWATRMHRTADDHILA